MLLESKKGVIQDLGTVIVFAFLMSLALVIIYIFVSETQNALEAGGADIEEAANRFGKFKNLFIPVFDTGFFTLLIGLVIAGVIGLFILETHPVLFIASAIGIVILMVIGMTVANAFDDFAESTPTLQNYVNEFTFIPLVMGNFFETLLVIAGLFSIALYAKTK